MVNFYCILSHWLINCNNSLLAQATNMTETFLQVRRAEVVTKMINRFPDMDAYFTEINHVLLASRGYEYDGFLFS